MIQVKSALLNKTGVTLVEVMIALVVLLFVSLALMQTALVSISANTRNSVRDAATSVAENRIGEARDTAWDKLVSETGTSGITLQSCQDEAECICKAGEGCTLGSYDSGFPVEIDKNIRNLTVHFGTRRVVSTLDSSTKQVTVVVRAVYNNKCYSQVSTTVVR